MPAAVQNFKMLQKHLKGFGLRDSDSQRYFITLRRICHLRRIACDNFDAKTLLRCLGEPSYLYMIYSASVQTLNDLLKTCLNITTFQGRQCYMNSQEINKEEASLTSRSESSLPEASLPPVPAGAWRRRSWGRRLEHRALLADPQEPHLRTSRGWGTRFQGAPRPTSASATAAAAPELRPNDCRTSGSRRSRA